MTWWLNNKTTKHSCKGSQVPLYLRTTIHCWWECKIVPPLWKTVQQSLKVIHAITLSPRNSIYGYIPQRTKNRDSNIYPWMFTAVLFIIAKRWKMTQLSINRWMDKQTEVYKYNVILFSLSKEWISLYVCWETFAFISLSLEPDYLDLNAKSATSSWVDNGQVRVPASFLIRLL